MVAPWASRTSRWVLGPPGARVLVTGTGTLSAAGGDPTDLGVGQAGALVAETVAEVGRAFVERCGLAGTSLRTVYDLAAPLDLGAAVADAAEQATDALVVYCTGLVFVDGDGMTHLATSASDTRPGRLPFTTLPLWSVLETMATSRAAVRFLVVDGLHAQADGAGPAVAPVLPAVPVLRAEAPAGGVEVLLLASPVAELTAADGGASPLAAELLRLLVNGDPDGPAELTVGHLARRITQRQASRGMAVLHATAPWSDGATLTGNAAHTPPIADLEPAQTTVLTEGPGPVITPAPLSEAATAIPPGRAPRETPGRSARADRESIARRGDGGMCPYPGLAAFDAGSQRWFFGRERATAEVLTRLEGRLGGTGPLVLVGASGSGKSSLLRAGLLPALADGAVDGSRSWPRVLMTPTDHPAGELARRVAEAAGLPVLGAAQLDVVSDPARFAGALSEILTLRPGVADSAGRRVVIVVDQFEETFTLCADEQERDAFIRALVAASRGTEDATPPAVVVLGVRADFYGWCAAYPDLVDALQTGQIVVGPMTAAQVRDAIVKPAEAVGLAVEPGLVDLMLHDIGAGEHGVAADPGSLPLLAHALLATWHEREGTTLTVAGYLRVGGLRGAIARTAEETFGALDAAGQEAARQILMRMVRFGDGTDDTRRRVRREELLAVSSSPADTAAVLDALIAARLVSVDADVVQLSHEALLRSWPRLREWIEVDRAAAVTRQQLADATATWDDGGRDPSYLFAGSRLATVRDWAEAADRRSTLTPATRDFLDASVGAERVAQRSDARRTRRLRQFVAGLTVLSLLATAAMAFAFQQRAQVADERDKALSAGISRQAEILRDSNPLVAAQLGAVAYELAPTPEARGAVLSTFASGYGFATRHMGAHTRPIGAVAYSRDGRLVATASDDWTVALWAATDPSRRTPLGTIKGHQLAVKSVAFSPDGRFLATGSDDRTVKLWTISDPTHPVLAATLPAATDTIFGLSFRPDGRLLATGGYGSEVRLWDVSDIGSIRQAGAITAHTDAVRAVTFGPDGTQLLTGSDDGRALLWDVRDPAAPAELSELEGEVESDVVVGSTDYVRAVAFSPDGRAAVTGSDDTTARVFDITDPRSPTTTEVFDEVRAIEAVAISAFDGLVAVAASSAVKIYDPSRHYDAITALSHGSKPWALAFSPDGRTLASGADDGTLRVWDVPGPSLVGHSRFLWSAAVHPGGKVLATGDYGQTVRLWDIRDRTRPVSTANLTGFNGPVDNVRFTPNGKVLVAASVDGGREDPTFDGVVSLWAVDDIHNPQLLTAIHPGIGGFKDLEVSPDGRTLALAGTNARLALWDISDPRQPRQTAIAEGHRYDVSTVSFSRDGRTLASGSSDRTVRLWDITNPSTPVTLSTITGFTTALIDIALSPDGKTLAAGSFDSKITLWDVADRRAPRALPSISGLSAGVNSIDFSSDGRLMAAAVGGANGVVRIWDVSDPADPVPHVSLSGFYNGFAAVAFAPDGAFIVGAPFQVVGFLWDLEPETVFERLCAKIGDPLTQEEWKQYLPDLDYDPPCS